MNAYRPETAAAFMARPTAAERLFRARQTAGLLRDQYRILRVAADSPTLADEAIDEIGALIQRLQEDVR